MVVRGKIVAVVTACALAACSQLPVDGPNHRSIEFSAATSLTTSRHDVAFDYALVDISQKVLDCIESFGPESFFRTFGSHRGPAPVIRVGVGDVLQISVFESAAG